MEGRKRLEEQVRSITFLQQRGESGAERKMGKLCHRIRQPSWRKGKPETKTRGVEYGGAVY